MWSVNNGVPQGVNIHMVEIKNTHIMIPLGPKRNLNGNLIRESVWFGCAC